MVGVVAPLFPTASSMLVYVDSAAASLQGGIVKATDYIAGKIDDLAAAVNDTYGTSADDASAESVVMSQDLFDALQACRRSAFWKYSRLRDLALDVSRLPTGYWAAALSAAVPTLFSPRPSAS